MYYGHNPKFPDNFMWGASSAAWQVEGGVADAGHHRPELQDQEAVYG